MNSAFPGRAAEILRTIRYATVATADARARPWNSPVYAVCADDLSVYWVSDQRNQHSRNVRQNPQVFLVYYDSTALPGHGAGVYFSATASELHDPADIRAASRLVDGDKYADPALYSGTSVSRLYRAVPVQAWMNTVELRDGAYVRDYRVEIPLGELRAALSRAFPAVAGPAA